MPFRALIVSILVLVAFQGSDVSALPTGDASPAPTLEAHHLHFDPVIDVWSELDATSCIGGTMRTKGGTFRATERGLTIDCATDTLCPSEVLAAGARGVLEPEAASVIETALERGPVELTEPSRENVCAARVRVSATRSASTADVNGYVEVTIPTACVAGDQSIESTLETTLTANFTLTRD